MQNLVQELCLLGTGYCSLPSSSPCWPLAVLADTWTLQQREKEAGTTLDLMQALFLQEGKGVGVKKKGRRK